MSMRIHLSRPDVGQQEIDAVTAVLRSPNLALGPALSEFENALAAYVGRRRAVAVNSGTSGLFLSLLALGVGPGDEVVTTPFTFIASATSIMMTGATPVFVDIDPVSLNIDPKRIAPALSERTKAILPVEVFGNPAGFDEIAELAERHAVPIVEDCCEALGSALHGRKAGTFGTLSVFGFYPNKQITTGEGGMILTDDDALAELCVSLRNQGRGPAAADPPARELGVVVAPLAPQSRGPHDLSRTPKPDGWNTSLPPGPSRRISPRTSPVCSKWPRAPAAA